MNKLILNFFGEEVTVETPKTLDNLRKEIANKFCFSPSDAAEILVSYYNELKKTFIKTEQDFFDFIKKKIYKVDLDINPDSQLYKKSVLQLEEETENNKKNLDELIKIKVELKAKKKQLVDEKTKQIKQMGEEIKELNRKRCKLIKETKKEKEKLSKEIEKTNTNIADLQMKLGMQVIELKKPESAKPKTKESPKQDKKKTKTTVKKVVKTVKKDVKKKVSKKSKEKEEKKPKEEKDEDEFKRNKSLIEKGVNKITIKKSILHSCRNYNKLKRKIKNSTVNISLEKNEKNDELFLSGRASYNTISPKKKLKLIIKEIKINPNNNNDNNNNHNHTDNLDKANEDNIKQINCFSSRGTCDRLSIPFDLDLMNLIHKYFDFLLY